MIGLSLLRPRLIGDSNEVAVDHKLNGRGHNKKGVSIMAETKSRKFLKSFEEAEADRLLYWELPRKTCEQIAPEMLRLKFKSKGAKACSEYYATHSEAC